MSLLVLTDRRQARGPLVEVVAAAIDGGARRVVLRERDLPLPARVYLAAQLRALLATVGGRLIVAGPEPLRRALTGEPATAGDADPGDGAHLAVRDGVRPAWARLLGRSCHDAGEVTAADDADYVTVSPVFATRSKPGYGPVLGYDGLRRLAAGTGRAVYALGGVDSPERVAGCRAAGAAGVAVMGAVMRAADPAAVVAALLAEVAP